MEELYSLIRVYLFFALYEFISVIFAIAVFFKPKFIFLRSRWQENMPEVPRWVKITALFNLALSSFFLGLIAYFWNLFNFKEIY